MASQQQIHANRANAQKSTGPASSEGKAKVSHNALKTGLTGRTVLLPTDDIPLYEAHTARVFAQYSPETEDEKRLTQSVSDTLWRLERISSLEGGIYAIGRRELASEFADEQDEAVRKALIEAKIFLTYRRDLNNLSIQESRLRRQLEKEDTALKRLIAERRAEAERLQAAEEKRWANAYEEYKMARENGLEFNPAEIGFEFSTVEEIVAREQRRRVQDAIQSGKYYWRKKTRVLFA